MSIRICILLALISMLAVACNGDDTAEVAELELTVSANMNNDALVIGQQYTTPGNQGLYFTLFKMYLSNISLTNDIGEETLLTEVVLHDFEDAESYVFSLPEGNYTALNFGLGLDETLNASDENSFDNDHPLSFTQNTHWGWASLYKFVMMEGRCSEDPDAELFPTTFAYHTGKDTMYRELTIPVQFEISKGEKQELNLALTLDELFNEESGVNIVTENFSHSGVSELPLAIRVTDLIAESFTAN